MRDIERTPFMWLYPEFGTLRAVDGTTFDTI